MTKPEKNNNFYLGEFLYRYKLLYLITFVGAIVIFLLIFKYNLPTFLIYIFMFTMLGLCLYRYSSFIKSKNIKAIKTSEGVVVKMEGKQWLEPKKYFQKVAIFLLLYYGLVGIFYLFTRMRSVVQLLIFLGLVIWGRLIKKGIIIKK